jgi:hypothetical protein
VLPLVETDEFHHGKVWLGSEDLDNADIRAILEAVRDAEDGEYVRVEGHDETVRVAKRGAYMHVRVEEHDSWGDADELVRIRIPMAVVEALIQGEGEELDVAAAVDALDELGKMELVSVDDGESTVRVWIDERSDDLDDDDYDDDRDDDRDY